MRGVRQHVNPLGLHYMVPRAERIERPRGLAPGCRVEVELGCADAQFSFDLARREPETLVVGLEIRDKLVERNRARARREALDNLVFAYVNLNVDLDRVFAPRSVHRFHLLFPDPWFKRRHQKRRVLDDALCRVMREQLVPGGELHFATDVFEVGLDALACMQSEAVEALGFRNLIEPWTFARRGPVDSTSAREDTTRARGQRVWRLRYGV